MHTPSVEIKNTELTLEELRADAQAAADHLSEVLQQTKEAEQNLEHVRAEAAAEKERIAEDRNKLQVDQLALDERKMNWEKGKAARQKEIDILTDQRKAAMRDLHNINEWIFSANQEYEQKQKELHDIKKEIAENGKLAERTLALQNEIAELEEKRHEANVEYNLARDNASVALKDLEWKQKRAEEMRDQAVTASLEAENDRQKTIQEKERIKKDLEIYIRRIEAHYQKAFPGLRMIL